MALLHDMATMKLLNEPEPAITARMIIIHTMGGFLKGTDSHFRNSTNLDAHFGIGGPADGPDLDGAIWQWIDTAKQADANRRANDFAIAIETSDGADHNNPWSPRQVDALVRLIDRLCELHSIPKRVVTSWNDPAGGLGWHTMWGAPSNWTPSEKVCPGPVRTAQFQNEVLPRLGVGGGGGGGGPTPGVVDPPWPGIVFERRKSKGGEVCRIQSRLRELGFAIDTFASCPFGPQTETAVQGFQRSRGLADHGKVDRDTWNALFTR